MEITVEKIGNFIWVITLGIIFSIFFSLFIFNYQFEKNNFFSVHIGDWLVGFGTILLGFFTWYLAQIEVDESRKERKILRLKEQLDFYLPLYTNIKIDEDNYTAEKLLSLHAKKQDVQFKSELYAKDKLTTLLRIYFQEDYLNKIEEEYDSPQLFYRDIINTILIDFEDLKKEYIKLTK